MLHFILDGGFAQERFCIKRVEQFILLEITDVWWMLPYADFND